MELGVEYIVKINQDIQIVIEQYRDDSVSELAEKFDINVSAKNLLNLVTKRLIAYSSSDILGQLNKDEDFCFKTIKLDKYGQLKESMSLPTFKYCDILEETWETSNLREYFKQKIFAFTVYKAIDREQYLNQIVIWKMPMDVLDGSVRSVWEKLYNTLSNGHIVKYIDNNGHYFSYFPASSDNPYVHVRPHAQNRQDTFPLPIADRLTGLVQYPKHSFWINRSYVLKIISRDKNNG